MRAGTQTLIQAIQAYPWTEEPEGDDEAIPPSTMNSDSSEEEQTGLMRSPSSTNLADAQYRRTSRVINTYYSPTYSSVEEERVTDVNAIRRRQGEKETRGFIE